MSARDSGSPEPSTDRTDVSQPAPTTPRTAPSAEAPSRAHSATRPSTQSPSIDVALSGTPVSRETPRPPTTAAPPDEPDRTPPVARDRRSELGPRTSIDTLLSAPVPADRFELHVEDRLDDLTTRMQELDQRLRRLELTSERPGREPRQVPGWIWIAFLVALALLAALMRLGR